MSSKGNSTTRKNTKTAYFTISADEPKNSDSNSRL